MGTGVMPDAAISIHAAREGGDWRVMKHCCRHDGISIHAAREGGDFKLRLFLNHLVISIHAVREGGDAV